MALKLFLKPAQASLGAVALLATLSACSPASAEPTVTVGPDTVLLDVRTAQEFADGHLDGAQNLDFNGGAVAAAIPNLDPNAHYLVYCRSGNRSGQAIALMQLAGITNLTNLGSLEEAARATGVRVVE